MTKLIKWQEPAFILKLITKIESLALGFHLVILLFLTPPLALTLSLHSPSSQFRRGNYCSFSLDFSLPFSLCFRFLLYFVNLLDKGRFFIFKPCLCVLDSKSVNLLCSLLVLSDYLIFLLNKNFLLDSLIYCIHFLLIE